MNNEMANSAANMMMAQAPTKDELITRDTVTLDPNIA